MENSRTFRGLKVDEVIAMRERWERGETKVREEAERFSMCCETIRRALRGDTFFNLEKSRKLEDRKMRFGPRGGK